MSRILGAALLGAAAALAWWEGGLAHYSVAGHYGVAAAIALVLASALLTGVGRQATTTGVWVRGPLALRRHLAEAPGATAAVFVWIALVLAVVGWDLNSFVHQSHQLPTLSSLAGHLTSHRGGRAATFALWLALGATLALGWRRSR